MLCQYWNLYFQYQKPDNPEREKGPDKLKYIKMRSLTRF